MQKCNMERKIYIKYKTIEDTYYALEDVQKISKVINCPLFT